MITQAIICSGDVVVTASEEDEFGIVQLLEAETNVDEALKQARLDAPFVREWMIVYPTKS